MVLGLTLGKSKRKHSVTDEPPISIRTSPSLPQLNPTTVNWPSDLVTDTNFTLDDSVSEKPTLGPGGNGYKGTSPPSLSRQTTGRTISFSKSFRRISATLGDMREKKDSLASTQHPPSAFERATSIIGGGSPLRSKRRPQNVVPNFNIMIVGAVGSGKTSLMRLLLGTSNISKGATSEQRAIVEQILQNPSLSNDHSAPVQSVSIEIEEGSERMILTLLDTPGFHHNELDLERAVTTLVRLVGARYDETLNEESKVVRQSGKGDHHIHLCIFLISPASLKETGTNMLKLHSADITAIQRLSERVNVLPVLSKTDTMTDERLTLVKAAVNRDLRAAGLPITLLGSSDNEPPSSPTSFEAMDVDLQEEDEEDLRSEVQDENDPAAAIEPHHQHHHNHHHHQPTSPPHVVRIRPTSAYVKAKRRRTFSQRSRSRARAALTDEDLEMIGDSGTGLFTMTELRNGLPFAIMSPNVLPTSFGSFMFNKEGAGAGADGSTGFPPSHVEVLSQARGQFTRKYRWGWADMLDPQHCDYLGLRHSILGIRMKMLKRITREVLYEKYRTEQLLARRQSLKVNNHHGKLL